MNFEELMPTLIDYGIQWGLVFLKAIAIFVIGRIAAGVITNILNRVMKRSKIISESADAIAEALAAKLGHRNLHGQAAKVWQDYLAGADLFGADLV